MSGEKKRKEWTSVTRAELYDVDTLMQRGMDNRAIKAALSMTNGRFNSAVERLRKNKPTFSFPPFRAPRDWGEA